jgi:hypothetical protein
MYCHASADGHPFVHSFKTQVDSRLRGNDAVRRNRFIKKLETSAHLFIIDSFQRSAAS